MKIFLDTADVAEIREMPPAAGGQRHHNPSLAAKTGATMSIAEGNLRLVPGTVSAEVLAPSSAA